MEKGFAYRHKRLPLLLAQNLNAPVH